MCTAQAGKTGYWNPASLCALSPHIFQLQQECWVGVDETALLVGQGGYAYLSRLLREVLGCDCAAHQILHCNSPCAGSSPALSVRQRIPRWKGREYLAFNCKARWNIDIIHLPPSSPPHIHVAIPWAILHFFQRKGNNQLLQCWPQSMNWDRQTGTCSFRWLLLTLILQLNLSSP